MYKKIFLFSAFILGVALPGKIFAFCPICTVAVGAGVGLSRWLGVDDLISGLWIGALIISTSVWFLNWLDSKNVKFPFRRLIVIFLFYFLTIAPLFWTNIIGHPNNKLFGADRLLLGIIFGTIIFVFSVWLSGFLKNKNSGKVFFPFQKIIFPVSLLFITSLIIYFIY